MATDPAEPRDVALRWAEALNARDTATLLRLCTDDVDCDPLQISASGRYDGPAGVRRWMTEVTTHDPGHQVNITGARTLADDRVAVFGELVMNGRPVSPYTMVTLLRDGK